MTNFLRRDRRIMSNAKLRATSSGKSCVESHNAAQNAIIHIHYFNMSSIRIQRKLCPR